MRRMSLRTAATASAVATMAFAVMPYAFAGDSGATSTTSTAPTPPGTAQACPSLDVPAGGFVDESDADVHAAAVSCVAYWGLTDGTSAGTFDPSAPVTRDQMASFLARLLRKSGKVLPAGGATFPDEPATDGHAADVDALAAAGIVKGTAAGTFDPSAPVTRDQMASFLVRAYDYRTGQASTATAAQATARFSDVSGDAHDADIAAAAQDGFTTGTAPGRFDPTAPVTRDQMASFLARVLDSLVGDGDAQVPSPDQQSPAIVEGTITDQNGTPLPHVLVLLTATSTTSTTQPTTTTTPTPTTTPTATGGVSPADGTQPDTTDANGDGSKDGGTDGSQVRRAWTDDAGQFAMFGVPAGTWTMTVVSGGDSPVGVVAGAPQSVTVPGTGVAKADMSVAVTNPAPTGTGTVSGTVTDTAGSPVAGAVVRLSTPTVAWNEGSDDQQVWLTTTTDSTGRYTFNDVTSGSHVVALYAWPAGKWPVGDDALRTTVSVTGTTPVTADFAGALSPTNPDGTDDAAPTQSPSPTPTTTPSQ